MVDREAATAPPPAPVEQEEDVAYKQLILQLADHPDPQVRVLAHISNRQFELSERLSALQRSIDDGFENLKLKMEQGFRDLKDRVAALDEGFIDVEERTSTLEAHHHLNGNSSPTPQ